jgi:hypothetical protein
MPPKEEIYKKESFDKWVPETNEQQMKDFT